MRSKHSASHTYISHLTVQSASGSIPSTTHPPPPTPHKAAAFTPLRHRKSVEPSWLVKLSVSVNACAVLVCLSACEVQQVCASVLLFVICTYWPE